MTETIAYLLGCRGEEGNIALPLSLKIDVYFALVRDFISLEFSLSAEIIESDSRGKIVTRVIWAPYYDRQTDTVIYGMPGTDQWDMEQVLANFVGDECAFPAIKSGGIELMQCFHSGNRKRL